MCSVDGMKGATGASYASGKMLTAENIGFRELWRAGEANVRIRISIEDGVNANYGVRMMNIARSKASEATWIRMRKATWAFGASITTPTKHFTIASWSPLQHGAASSIRAHVLKSF